MHASCFAAEPFSPDKPGASTLLRVMGLLNADGSLGDGALKKYKQINKLFLHIENGLNAALKRDTTKPMMIVDLCAGQGQMSLLIAHASRHRWPRAAKVCQLST